jgi:hypothetical protein
VPRAVKEGHRSEVFGVRQLLKLLAASFFQIFGSPLPSAGEGFWG